MFFYLIYDCYYNLCQQTLSKQNSKYKNKNKNKNKYSYYLQNYNCSFPKLRLIETFKKKIYVGFGCGCPSELTQPNLINNKNKGVKSFKT